MTKSKFLWICVCILFIILILRSKSRCPNLKNFNTDLNRFDGQHKFLNVTDGSYFQVIPKIIIQTNEKQKLSKQMQEATDIILKLNPEYKYMYFSDEDCRKYLIDNFDASVINAYDKLIPGAYKADLFRYAILYMQGGVYIDTGIYPYLPLSKILDKDDTFVSPEDNGTGGIYNAFIACTAGHPIIEEALKSSIKNIKDENYGDDALSITGPQLLSKAYKKVTGKKVMFCTVQSHIRILSYEVPQFCKNGIIYIFHDDKKIEALVKLYSTYGKDRKNYNTKPHYSKLWAQRNVFKYTPSQKLLDLQQNLMTLLEGFISIAEKLKITYWISDGTLLGAVRHKQIIPWDDDIDLKIPKKDMTILRNNKDMLNRLGYDLVYEDDIWRFKFSNDERCYIDLFEMQLFFDTVYIYTSINNFIRWPKGYMWRSEVHPIKNYDFGRLHVKGPSKYHTYLKRSYGNWKVPSRWKPHHFL